MMTSVHFATQNEVQRSKQSPPAAENSPAFFAGLLKSCGNSQDLSQGRLIHRRILQSDHHRNIYLRNLTMEMYGKCGSPEEARRMFDEIESGKRNVFSWNIMMAAYAQNRHIDEAREIFDSMPDKDVVSWNTIVGAYAQFGHLREAGLLFNQMPRRTIITWNIMTAAYVQYGDLNEARLMFERIPDQNAISWNIMLVAYAQRGYLAEAEETFRRMKEKDVASWNAMIAAYAHNGRLDGCREVFHQMPVKDVISWNAMITANSQNGELPEARKIFDSMPKRNLVSWNAIITAYVESEDREEAILLLGLMDIEGLEPNGITIVSVLTVCSTTINLAAGKLVHSSIAHKRCLSDVIVGTSLLNMYASCSSMEDAWSFFVNMSKRNVVTWNVMITGYVHNNRSREAFVLYCIMNLEGECVPNEITFVSSLDACAGIGSLPQGRIIHEIVRSCDCVDDVVVGTALVNMYGKCGSPDESIEIFLTMPVRNEVTWNSIIAIYAQYGHGKLALRFFQLMHLEGEEPSGITFINLFSAFSHGAGLMKGGAALLEGFVSIVGEYRELLCSDHYICLIDILGRAGWLQEAEDLMRLMPFEANSIAWMTLLGACKLHGDSERAMVAADVLFRMDPGNPAPYVLLSSAFAKKTVESISEQVRTSSTAR